MSDTKWVIEVPSYLLTAWNSATVPFTVAFSQSNARIQAQERSNTTGETIYVRRVMVPMFVIVNRQETDLGVFSDRDEIVNVTIPVR